MHRLQAFTDREDEVALFQELRGPNADGSWPLLPILAFIAPGGSGKSTLIDHLIECCSVDGQPAVPYAHLNFTVSSAPKDLRAILLELRNQLQDCADGQGNRLTFPRFDLGTLITQAPTEDLSDITPSRVQRTLSRDKQAFESLTAAGSTLAFLVPYLPAVLAGIKLVGQIPAVQDIVQRILGHLGDSTDWKWYRNQLRLSPTAGMNDVLLRLYEWSRRGKPEREQLVINKFLPAALAADLYGALVEATPPRAWTKRANVVIFLDGFEALQDASSTTATSLLRGLATEPRNQGQTDPLLLVIGGRAPLTGMTADAQPAQFAQTAHEGAATATQRMRDLHTQWQRRSRSLPYWLEDLVLPVRLHDFGLDHTRSYLLEVGEERGQRAVFEADDLVKAIAQVTHGQPLFLALAAEAVLKARRPLLPAEFQRAPVSPEIDPEHEGEAIGDYLVDLLLKQLPAAERKDLIFCAVPRVLDEDILREVLPSLDDIDARARWEDMQQRSFLSPVNEQRSVVHPVVRELLLHRLPVSKAPQSTFVKIHTRLKNYFTQRSADGEDEARIEAAYHALALGDADPAIRLGILAQGSQMTRRLWDSLLEAVRQAPTDLLPEDSKAHAWSALVRAPQQHEVHDAATTAVVLYTWLLSAGRSDREESARLQNYLGLAYSYLPIWQHAANLRNAIACHEAALQVYTAESSPLEWAATQKYLGAAYRSLPGSSLPGGDRDADLRHAIVHYEAALRVYTAGAFPFEYAAVQNILGNAYTELPTGDREANLQHAIDCYQAASHIYTQETSPAYWAMTQYYLGNAYSSLSSGDRDANLRHAIVLFEAALQVYTPEASPFEWAENQTMLGLAYSTLSGGDRDANLQEAIVHYEAALQTPGRFPNPWMGTQHNVLLASMLLGDAKLRQAIAGYEAALQNYTPEAFPLEWAETQTYLGNAYWNLPTGDRVANLQQVINCYQAALQVYTPEAFPADWARIQKYLEAVYRSRMDVARERDWTPVEKWGSGGWALGSWPQVVVYHRDGEEGFELAVHSAGEVTENSFPTVELRDVATDEVAVNYWTQQSAPLVEGVESAQQMPAQLRGPYMPPSDGEHINGVE